MIYAEVCVIFTYMSLKMKYFRFYIGKFEFEYSEFFINSQKITLVDEG